MQLQLESLAGSRPFHNDSLFRLLVRCHDRSHNDTGSSAPLHPRSPVLTREPPGVDPRSQRSRTCRSGAAGVRDDRHSVVLFGLVIRRRSLTRVRRPQSWRQDGERGSAAPPGSEAAWIEVAEGHQYPDRAVDQPVFLPSAAGLGDGPGATIKACSLSSTSDCVESSS